MRAQLIPLDGGAPITLTKELTVVGRNPTCDVRLDHKSVSKLHCVLVKTDGLVLIRDLGSTNGTRVNGIRIRRGHLLPNDKLQIAGCHFQIIFGPSEPPAAKPNDPTQQIQAADIDAMLARAAAPDRKAESGVESNVPFRVNALPDAYPE
ncbi:MAG: FHA domain-containing protein [Gemmatales bacterium]|nr:FHA domain-containing protein [Gemmatales bacterium]MDW8387798.1 FHA domain-containing protein [Gemmatales bacterium]